MSAEPGLMDSPEYTELFQLVQGKYPLDRLAHAVEIQRAAAELVERCIGDAFGTAANYAEIARALGTSRQAVFQRVKRRNTP